MAVVITPKRGDSDPGTDDIADGEIAIRKDVNPPKLFVRVGSNIREIGAGEANQTLTTGDGISGANSGDSGDFTMAVDAAQTTITSMFATDLKIGEDDQTKIDFETANQIHFYLNNAKDFSMTANTFTAESGSSIVVPAGGLTIGSTAVSSTAAELNILDGVTASTSELNKIDGYTGTTAELNYNDTGVSAGTVAASKTVVVDSNKDIASFRNVTLTGELDAATGDFSGDVDIDGTLEADAITVDGTALAEVISDTTGAMFSSNTETGLSATYQDGDNTIDLAIDAAQTTITSILATDLKIGEDDQTKIDFETADTINFYAANAKQLVLEDGALYPGTDDDLDLGKSGTQFKNGYFDGTVEVDALTIGGVDIRSGNLTISGSPTFSGTPEVTGTLEIAGEIQHLADTNNSIAFGTDTQTYETGGSTRLDISDSGVRLGAANARVTTILDEDNMASDSATALATQQSIKAYVDANAGGSTGNFSFSGNTFSNSNDILVDGNGDITLDANGGDIFFHDNTTKFGTIKNDSGGLDIHAGNQTTIKAVKTDSAGKFVTGHNYVFVVSAGVTNLGSSSNEKLISFNTTNGNTAASTPGNTYYNQTFVCPCDLDLVNVFGSFDKAIADGNLSNEVVFRLTVADDGSQSFSDKYKMTEQIIDPSANISSFTQASMNAAGRMFDFIADAGHVTNTGTAGVQSFTKGQKISGGLKVSSSVNTSIRGNFTFVFRTTGGMEFA